MCSSTKALGLSTLRKARPAGVARTTERPFATAVSRRPRSVASSQTGSLGQDVRQASIVSRYVRSLRTTHSTRSRMRFSTESVMLE